MPYTLVEAAKAAGCNRSTILRAIKAGRISATRDEATQAWLVEPVELHRVFPAAGGQGEPERTAVRPSGAQAAAQVEIRELRAQLAGHERTIDDLRRRLDSEAEERRQAQTQLTALLTDQRAPTRRTGLVTRLFRRREPLRRGDHRP